jgi:hypothetical protein
VRLTSPVALRGLKGQSIDITRSEGQEQRPSDSITVEEMEVADKAMGRKNSRNDKYRQLCEGMRDLMQEFP